MDVHREEEGEEREINNHGKTIKVKKKKKTFIIINIIRK